MTRQAKTRGAGVLEFTLVGIPLMFLMISVVEMSRGMWNYHTLARAVTQTTRFASMRGSDCSLPGNSCAVTVGTITTKLATEAIGVPQSSLSVTLTTDSGVVTTCNPVSNCTSSATVWPPSASGDNARGKKITISAQYAFRSALAMYWPGAGTVNFSTFNLPAAATQQIVF